MFPKRVVESGAYRKLCPEQKNISLIEGNVAKFKSPGSLVQNLFSGTLATVEACSRLKKLHEFVECDVDTNSIKLFYPL